MRIRFVKHAIPLAAGLALALGAIRSVSIFES